MVLLVTTPTVIAALERLSSSTRDDLQLPTTPAVGEPISHDQVISLARYFTSGDGSTGRPEIDADDGEQRLLAAPASSYTLNTLLRGTEVYIPPASPKPEPVQFFPCSIYRSHSLFSNFENIRVPNMSLSKRASKRRRKNRPTNDSCLPQQRHTAPHPSLLLRPLREVVPAAFFSTPPR
jgi:hypothetical protein